MATPQDDIDRASRGDRLRLVEPLWEGQTDTPRTIPLTAPQQPGGRASARRSRVVTGGLLAATMAAGLASRRYPAWQPEFVARYAGDALWAAMVFWLLASVRPRCRTGVLGFASLGIAFVVECSQLYRAPWIDHLRATTLGALVLGQGFLWSDLWCYVAGVVLAAALDGWIRRS